MMNKEVFENSLINAACYFRTVLLQYIRRRTPYVLASWHLWVYQRGIHLGTKYGPGVPMSWWWLGYMGGMQPVRSVQ